MREWLLRMSLIFLSATAILIYFAVYEIREMDRNSTNSFLVLKHLDSGNYLIASDLGTDKEMSYKLKIVHERSWREPKNDKHKEDLKWVTSKIRVIEYDNISSNKDRSSVVASMCLDFILYSMLLNVVLINLTVCKDAKQSS